MEKMLRILLYASVFTPLIVAHGMFFPFIAGKMLAFQGLALIAALLWLYLWSKNPARYNPKITWLTLAIGVYILINIIAALQGANFWRSFWSNFERMEGIFIWVVLFLFFIVLGVFYKRREDWLLFFRLSLLVSIIVGIRAVIFFGVFEGNLFLPASISGVFGNPIYLAIYAFFHIGISLILLRSLDYDLRNFRDFFPMAKSFWAVFYGLGFVINILILFSSFARGVMLGFFFGALVFAFLYSLYGRERKFLLKAVGVVLLLVVLTFPFWKEAQLVNRIYSISSGFRADETRIINWKVAFNAFLARPLLGWGPENYFVAQNEFYNPRLQSLIDKSFDRVHNKYLEILVEAGVGGIGSYLFVFIIPFLTLWKARGKEPFLTALLAGLFIGYLIQNITAFDNPGSYLPLFSLLAFVNSEFFEPRFQIKPTSWLVAGGWLLIAMLLWQGVWQPYQANVALAKTLSLQERPQKDYEQILAGYKRALSYQSLGDYEIRTRLGVFVANTPELTRDLPDLAIRELDKELEISDQDVRVHLLLAKLYERRALARKSEGDKKSAEEHFLESIALAPSRPDTIQHYAVSLINQGESEKARAELLKIKELDEDVFKSHEVQWYLGMTYYLKDDFARAYEQFQKVIEYGGGFSDEQELLILGRTAFELKKYDEVVMWYKKLVELFPTEALYRMYLAIAYKQVGDIVRATDFAYSAAKFDPSLQKEVEGFVESTK